MCKMKALSTGFVLACQLSFVNAATAEEQTSLLGDWECIAQGGAWYAGLFPAGSFSYEMTIEEQMGPAFSGHYIWEWERTGQELEEEHIAVHAHGIISDDGTTVKVRENFVGVIGPQANAITMVEIDDTMRIDGSIVDDNTIESVWSRSGRFAGADIIICERTAS